MSLLGYTLSGACSVEPDCPDWTEGKNLEQLYFRGFRKRGNLIQPSVQFVLDLNALRPQGTGSAGLFFERKAPIPYGTGYLD